MIGLQITHIIIPFEYEKVDIIHNAAVRIIFNNVLFRYLFKYIIKIIQKDGTAVMN